MPKVNASEFAEKWSRRLKGATEDIARGVEKVTQSPSKKAAEKIDKLRARLLAAIDSGKMKAALESVDVETWKKFMKEKGLSRISAGVDLSTDKVAKVAEQLLAYEDALQKEISKMPDLTLDDSINRATAWIRGMSKFKKK